MAGHAWRHSSKMAEVIYLPFGQWTQAGRRKHKFNHTQSYSYSSWDGTMAPPGEYDWTVRLWRRCCLMSNYFDHLLCWLLLLHVVYSWSHVTLCRPVSYYGTQLVTVCTWRAFHHTVVCTHCMSFYLRYLTLDPHAITAALNNQLFTSSHSLHYSRNTADADYRVQRQI